MGGRYPSTVTNDGSQGGPNGGGRRQLLKGLAVACAGGATLAAVGPAALVAVVPPPGKGGGRWIRTLPLASLVEGEPKRVHLVADHQDAWTVARAQDLGSVWLVKRGTEVKAWTAVCPHLGCTIDVGAKGFSCPCHDSSFGPDGAALSGPSPRGMDPLATRIDDGAVMVELRRYRQGGKERIEVG